MFTYIPMITDWIKLENNKWDKIMYEANFIISHKSEHTRKLLKWFEKYFFVYFLSLNLKNK
jgi:hypothetical protein